jgi:hypothetical protein
VRPLRWEILLAGAVPIVQYFPEQDALLDGLPVLRVRDWSLVTPAFLDAEWDRLQSEAVQGAVSWTKVYFPFWFHEYTAHLGTPRRASIAASAVTTHLHPPRRVM